MLDERDPLSQLGSQWDGDEQGGQRASHGAQPSIRSSPWNTGPIRKAATSSRDQSRTHRMPETVPRTQSHTWSQPTLLKMLGDSGVNSRTEKLCKIRCCVAEQISGGVKASASNPRLLHDQYTPSVANRATRVTDSRKHNNSNDNKR